jgi:hypothetical protein
MSTLQKTAHYTMNAASYTTNALLRSGELAAPLMTSASTTLVDSSVTLTRNVVGYVRDAFFGEIDARPASLIARIFQERDIRWDLQTPTLPSDHFGTLSSEVTAIQLHFISESCYGNPGHGPPTWSHNYLHYLSNNHPLLSIFLHHPLNNFSTCKRITHLFCTLTFTLFLSVCLSYISNLSRNYCDGGCAVISYNENASNCTMHAAYPTYPTYESTKQGCCVGNTRDVDYPKWLVDVTDECTNGVWDISDTNKHEWLTVGMYDGYCYYNSYHNIVSLAMFAFLATPYDIFLKYCGSGCHCQKRCCCLKNSARLFGCCFLFISTVTSLYYLTISLVFIIGFDIGKQTAVTFVIGQTLSWVFWIPQKAVYCYTRYEKDRDCFRRLYPGLDFIEIEKGGGGDKQDGGEGEKGENGGYSKIEEEEEEEEEEAVGEDVVVAEEEEMVAVTEEEIAEEGRGGSAVNQVTSQ